MSFMERDFRFIEKMKLKTVGDWPVFGVPAQNLFSDFNSPQKTRVDSNSNFREKCESLASSGLVEGGVHVIAPVEILKQIFRTPYSLYSPVSIAIQVVGQTLVLRPGFDAKEQNSQPVDEFFPNFVMHSVRTHHGCSCLPVQVNEKLEPLVDCEKHTTSVTNEFSRLVDCQFGEFRMRLGSDMVLFRNEKNEAVQPLTRLEAWLDNVMANVPELAGCYHQVGHVKGYELTKTEDIYQPYGFPGDAPPAFDPNLVQENALDVLRFLLSNCKEDPGVYWLYKSAREHVIQLFDVSKKHSSSHV
ncbi:unnamed protein product [Microthlaspi erraticum]|uniref:EDRF1 N-terminal domain-containing protein n=1 Tax=Microthlaspi erraticum TaxID=1685480 RepID=A0A6D2HJB4_9BRAS|nr:unnamed protein product [Microthlaspi erraticum]